MYYPSSENKGTDQLAVTAKLICVFVFAYADCWFSHEVAHLHLKKKRENIQGLTQNLSLSKVSYVLLQMCYTKYKDGKYYKGCADEDMCEECKGSDDCKCCQGRKCNEEGVTEDGMFILFMLLEI